MYFGIVSKNCQLLNNDKYKNFPLCAFDDCYGFDLNDTFYENRNHRNKKIISVGTIISIKVNLNKNKISIFIDGKKIQNNTINIKDETLGYYPAFSLSNGNEIQVKFGGIYNLFVYFETAYQIDAKPICQYNNLENIVSCYLKIVDNYLIKIINHIQISYNDSIKYFNPLIQFFANIAFNDEYIIKNYILKFMYKDYIHGKDINKHFEERFNFFYLIINNIEKSKQQESILFLLDCLSEDIKLDSYIFDSNEKMKNVCLSIRLYNYFLKKKLFKEILFPRDRMNELVYKKIKYQLFIIFQSLTICVNNNLIEFDFEIAMKITKRKISKFVINNNFIEYYSELIETLLELEQDIPKSIDDKIDKLIMKLNYENKDSENNIEQNEGIECKFLYRKIFLDLINDIFENISNKNIYNVISTIFLPLLNLFNIYYKKESSLKYTKGNILAYLPFLRNDMIYLMCKSSKFLVNLDIVDKNNINNTLKDITGLDFLNKELDQKNLNISSTLIKLIINLSVFFEKEIFNFDLYLQNRDYKHILKIWKSNSKEFKINNYTENMKKLIYLYNENNYNVLKITLNHLIPYFYELLNNNCYLFLPYQIMNLFKFFIKFITYHYFIYRDDKIIKNKNTTKLIQLYVSLNFKLLYCDNTTDVFFLDVFDNIKFIYNVLFLINENKPESSGNDSDDELNNSFDEDIKSFNFYIKKNDIENLTASLKLYYENHEISDKKKLTDFLIYFSHKKLYENKKGKNIFITAIINTIDKDNNNFWFRIYIIEYLVNRELVNIIHRIENILNVKERTISNKKKEKIEKYYNFITKILNFLSNFISDEKVLNKYFNFYISDGIVNPVEQNDSDNFSIYCYFIYSASLIIKNLLNSNFINFYRNNDSIYLYRNDTNVHYLIRECFNFLETIFIDIPRNYERILKKREENINNRINNENKINNEENKKEKEELNEDLKHYYINIVNNIKIQDAGKLTALFENNIILRTVSEALRGQLRKFMIFLNSLEMKYDLLPNNKKNESQDSNLCPICLDKKNEIHVNPCEHMFCFNCIKKLTNRKCPICRAILVGIKEHPEFKFEENIQNI